MSGRFFQLGSLGADRLWQHFKIYAKLVEGSMNSLVVREELCLQAGTV